MDEVPITNMAEEPTVYIHMAGRDALREHPGIWAVIDRPADLPVGSVARFECAGAVLFRARITAHTEPGVPLPGHPGLNGKAFGDWWKIHFTVLP